jgi:hypothetical protein
MISVGLMVMELVSSFAQNTLEWSEAIMSMVFSVSRTQAQLVSTGLAKFLEHQKYIIFPNLNTVDVIDNKYNLPLSAFIGPLGLPGNTSARSLF